MIIELHLHRPAEFYPGWHPGIGGTRGQYAFKVKDGYQIVRDGPVYVVTHTRDGVVDRIAVRITERTEIPLANVKNAVLAGETLAVDPPAEQGKRR